MRHITVIASTFVLGSGAASAATIHVPADAPTIQIAINLAGDGDEIIVAPGTYFESIDLTGKDLILRASGGPDVTTIDALGQFDSAIHCTQGEGPTTLISGFTIRRGDATGSSPEDRGGAIFVQNSSPTIELCHFEDNVAVYGGAIYSNGATLTLRACRFLDNAADNSGGAVYSNQSALTVTECDFVRNESFSEVGGAVRVVGSNVTIETSVFDDNASPNFGGAVSVQSSTFTLHRSRLHHNFSGDGAAQGRGGAVFTSSSPGATISDSIFTDNGVTQYGGAIYAASDLTVTGCSFVGNEAGGGNGVLSTASATARVYNSIAWDNGADAIGGSGTPIVRYSNVQGGFGGEGNIDVNPGFVDHAGRDLRLEAGSLCVDAGDTTQLAGSYPVDFDGAERGVNEPDHADTGLAFLNLAVDMGAHELQPQLPADPCPGDADRNGMIDVADLLMVLSGWGTCP